MPKVGNKSFPYTAKGIDDAKKEKKRIASGGTPQKRKPKMNTYTYKAEDGSLQAYSNSAAYQAKVGNKAAGKEAAAEKKANGKTAERRPLDPNRVKPKPMPRMPLDPNRVRPKPMPRKPRDPNRIPPVKMPLVPRKRPETMATIKPAKRRPVKTSPMKKVK